jgi:hypothetical protein
MGKRTRVAKPDRTVSRFSCTAMAPRRLNGLAAASANRVTTYRSEGEIISIILPFTGGLDDRSFDCETNCAVPFPLTPDDDGMCKTASTKNPKLCQGNQICISIVLGLLLETSQSGTSFAQHATLARALLPAITSLRWPMCLSSRPHINPAITMHFRLFVLIAEAGRRHFLLHVKRSTSREGRTSSRVFAE